MADLIEKARRILEYVNAARSMEDRITSAELKTTKLQSAWQRMADSLGNADHFAEMFVAACKESGTGKEADEQTEKNSRTWNRDLQFASTQIGEAYRSGNMKDAKSYFSHLKTLRAQLADEISELKQTLVMADKMISERDRMLFEGSPGEHKEDASEKAAERVSLSAVFGGDKNGELSAEDNEGAKRAIGQANRLLSDAATPMVAAAEALSGNWLAKMRAARGLQHIRDAMQSVARARSALNDSAGKEASEKAAIADVEASDARIKSLAPALVAAIDKGMRTIEGVRNMVDRDHPSTDYYGSSIGDALRSAMGRAPGIADDLTAEIKRNRSMNAEASSEWPRKKEASDDRPRLPSGRYADVDPGRLLGED